MDFHTQFEDVVSPWWETCDGNSSLTLRTVQEAAGHNASAVRKREIHAGAQLAFSLPMYLFTQGSQIPEVF